MILELDFSNKTIKIKGTIKVSELMAKLKEHNIGNDWSFESDIIEFTPTRLPDYTPPFNPNNPWETPIYDTNPFWVTSVWCDEDLNSEIKTTLTVN